MTCPSFALQSLDTGRSTRGAARYSGLFWHEKEGLWAIHRDEKPVVWIEETYYLFGTRVMQELNASKELE